MKEVLENIPDHDASGKSILKLRIPPELFCHQLKLRCNLKHMVTFHAVEFALRNIITIKALCLYQCVYYLPREQSSVNFLVIIGTGEQRRKDSLIQQSKYFNFAISLTVTGRLELLSKTASSSSCILA